ncbi:MAG: hypothetical protein QOF02_4124 [Blastocatellia bacterium]|jgi:hypothetical protein|nr:hypothetical protein [Blastocatellia bacterium]
MKRCPTCDRTYSDEQVFCSIDGATLVESMSQESREAAPDYSATPGINTPPPPTQASGPGAMPGYQPPPPPGMFPPPSSHPSTATGSAGKLQPALIGGVMIGVLSIGTQMIPVPAASWCCCLWGALGGVVAVYLYVKRSPVPVRVGDGAILGLMAGGIGALVYALIALPITYFVVDPEQLQSLIEARLRRSGSQFDIRPYWGWLLLLGVIIQGCFLAVLSLLGGLLGVPIFEKRKAEPAPPPPPQYS